MSRGAGVDPAAGVETLLFVSAAGKRDSIKIMCTNRNNALATVRVALRPASGPTTSSDWLAYDEAVPAKDSRVSAPFDVSYPEEVTVSSDIGDVTFQANVIERDQ